MRVRWLDKWYECPIGVTLDTDSDDPMEYLITVNNAKDLVKMLNEAIKQAENNK